MKYHKKRAEWFNISQLAPPLQFLSGWADPTSASDNAGKDAIVGPGRVNLTTSLYKSFAIVGSARFDAPL